MPILTIKAVEDKGSYKLATDTKGKKYSIWPEVKGDPNPVYAQIRPGMTADFEVYQKGEYTNIIGMSSVSQAAPKPQGQHQAEQGGPVDAEIIKRASIEAQTAYNGLIALAVAGKCPPETLTMALNWAKMRLCQPVDPDEVPF